MTVSDMFRSVDLFFQSLGILPMTQKFWENSIFTKQENMVCHASAWDFKSGNAIGSETNGYTGDFRKDTEKFGRESWLTISDSNSAI